MAGFVHVIASVTEIQEECLVPRMKVKPVLGFFILVGFVSLSIVVIPELLV